ncbi:MAG: ribonuclease E activity regulator RraA [Pseudomonadota bacterium]
MTISTPDLCDAHPSVDVLDTQLRTFGGRAAFAGNIITIRCFEDNSLVKAQAAEPGAQRVMVVDGGGLTRRALLGDMIAAKAVDNGWAGLVIWGAVRDVEALGTLPLGVQALAATPRKTEKRGLGDLNVPIHIGGVTFKPGDWVAADTNGVIRADSVLL